MLVVAAVAHDSASIALLAIGGTWFAIGLGGFRYRGKLVREVRLEDGYVTFVSLNGKTTVAATDIVEVWRPRYDINRFGPLEVRTKSHGAIRVDSHLRGLIDLLLELRLLNPGLKTERV
jgi:hypothetical protein